jgi:biotin-dependent carboxylase-like uncharacterized protein
MTALVVTSCGPMTSLQDFGRIGWQRHGVANSGALDRLALAAANALVGNPADTAAVEFMLLGGTFTLDGGSARVAVAGAPCAVRLDGAAMTPMTSLTMHTGQTLAVETVQAGVYAYLAIAGGVALEPQQGSLSLHARAGIGGFAGRPLQAGDHLPLRAAEAPPGDEHRLDPLSLEPDAPIRAVLGPQADYFTDAGIETFLSQTYRVSPQADRMGYRLSGPKIEHAGDYNIVSDGIVAGSVQVPGSGEPIVMMADRQTTGGYPKIATVISADLRVIAQRRPGAPVRFQAVNIEEAQRLARERGRFLAELRVGRRGGGVPSTEDLLGLNLAGAVVDAHDPDG